MTAVRDHDENLLYAADVLESWISLAAGYDTAPLHAMDTSDTEGAHA